jgi:predicted esterase
MRSRSSLHYLKLAAILLVQCASSELPPAPRPAVIARAQAPATISRVVDTTVAAPSNPPPGAAEPAAGEASPVDAGAEPDAAALPEPHCPSAPPLGPDGAVPSAPPHAPLGQNFDIPGDRAAYVLPGNPDDRRVIVYLHGMCGDVTAPDYFRESLRQRGTLLALRGDTPCAGDRFKWRDDPARILQRLRAALKRLNEQRGSELSLDGVILFGYSQGADRAEKLAQQYPKLFPRVVLGGPPMRASAVRLARAQRVAILGGELETTETMRAGADALEAAGIACRYFTLECAYHGYYGSRPEEQLSEVLDWVGSP